MINWTMTEDDYIQRHYADESDCEIAFMINRNAEAVAKRRSQLGFLRSRLPKGSTPQAKVTDPTPEQIAAACAKIRAKWTKTEYKKRATWAYNGAPELPLVRVAGRLNSQTLLGASHDA